MVTLSEIREQALSTDYVCICGCYYFLIRPGEVVCTHCTRRWEAPMQWSPKTFNEIIRASEQNTCGCGSAGCETILGGPACRYVHKAGQQPFKKP